MAIYKIEYKDYKPEELTGTWDTSKNPRCTFEQTPENIAYFINTGIPGTDVVYQATRDFIGGGCTRIYDSVSGETLWPKTEE